ncbi:MAG TPA: glycosyltransferase [Pyrinomonadaceae bacterium]|jgi:glycosyltransferase involved in cell wall biosynthesis|nr:glycosyltransferase [Pyrinomonadaceae bacterium]
MLISIETPVIKGGWLIPCIESVMYQTSTNWELSLVWDGGDDLSKKILEQIEQFNHPKIKVYFQERQGIAISRAFLSAKSKGDFILPLDDDDMLAPDTVERFLTAAQAMPWSGIIRARRKFIDEHGQLVDMEPWFPFEPRHYQNGMVNDLLNHSQPYLIRRSAYERTSGWEGFADFFFAGEDCDIFTKIEEVATIELLDECLYYYRLNSQRTSHALRPEGALEMWRRLADRTISRLSLPLKRENETQPFKYSKLPLPPAAKDQIDFVLPSFESDEEELEYLYRRPSAGMETDFFAFNGRNSYEQIVAPELVQASRLVLICSFKGPVYGTLKAVFFEGTTAISAGECRIEGLHHSLRPLSIGLTPRAGESHSEIRLQLDFIPDRKNYNELKILRLKSRANAGPEQAPVLIMRLFKQSPGNSRKLLERCLNSLQRAGIAADAIHVVAKQQSCSLNRNEGFRKTVRPYICFLDDDVEIMQPDFFERLLGKMEEHEADLIGPKIVTAEERIFCAAPYFNEKRRPVPRGLGEIDVGHYDFDCEVPWLPSTLVLIKREVVNAVGWFDESFLGSQLEDVDLCLKARLRDFKCVYTGSVSVVHYNNQRNDSFSENLHFFNEKWKNYPWLFEAAALPDIK